MSNHFARGIAPSAVESRETREARESRETRNRCYRCGATDLVIDAKAADRICRSCGEVQAACLIDTEEEFRLYPDDSDDGKSTQRSSGAGDSVSGDRFVFVGSNPDELALLARSAYSVLAIREKAIVEATSVCKDISYALNLTKRITDGAETILTAAYDDPRPELDTVRQAMAPSTAGTKQKINSSLRTSGTCVAAAAIYLSCRQNNAGRTLDEVCLAAGLTKPTTTSSAGKGNGNDYGTSSSHISEGTGTLAVSSVTVHTGTRSYVSKLQQQLAQWLNLVGPGGHSLPPVRSSHVVARLAAFTLRSPIALNSNKESQDQGYGQGHERESNSLLIERMRWLAGELDSYEADTLSTLPPQQLAAAVVLAISAAQRCLLDINALARATISCTVQGVLDAYVRAVPFINGIMRRVAKRSIKIATMAAKDKSIEKEKEMRVTFDNPLVVAGSGVGSKRGRDLVLATGDHGDGDIKGRGDAASSAYVFIVPVLPPSLADWVDARQVLQLLPLPSSAGKGAVVDIASMLPPSPYSHSLSSSSSAPVSLLPLVPLSSSMKRVGSQEGMASFSTSSTSAYTRSPVSIFLPSRRTVSPSINSNTGLGSGGGTGNSQKSFWNASGSKSGSGGSLSRNSSTGSLGSTESRAGDEDKDKDKESPPISKKS